VERVKEPPIVPRLRFDAGGERASRGLKAYDGPGKVVDQASEEHGLAPEPRQLFLVAKEIVRVQLATNNRFGAGTWATWNSLPITEIGIER
jgi:hypothetical protein